MIYTYTISIYLNLKYIYLKQNYISSFNHKPNRKSPDCIPAPEYIYLNLLLQTSKVSIQNMKYIKSITYLLSLKS